MLVFEEKKVGQAISLTIDGRPEDWSVDPSHWAAFRNDVRNALRRAMTSLTRTFRQAYPSVVKHAKVEERGIADVLGSRVRANLDEMSIGMTIDDPIWPYMEYTYDKMPRAHMPPWAEGTRLWRWVQRQDGNDPAQVSINRSTWPVVRSRARSLAQVRGHSIRESIKTAHSLHGPTGTSAYPVAVFIKENGTKGKYAMRDAFERSEVDLNRQLNDILGRYL